MVYDRFSKTHPVHAFEDMNLEHRRPNRQEHDSRLNPII